jgi:hypothetical protein
VRWHYQFQLAKESMGAGNSCRNHPAPKNRAPIATARPGLRPDRVRLGSLDQFDKLIPRTDGRKPASVAMS